MESWQYLGELRTRLIRSAVFVAFIFSVLVWFANPLYHTLALPLLARLPVGDGLIATHVAASLFVPLKFVFVLTIFLSIPFLLWQVWNFIAPALYRHERYSLWILLLGSTVLFYLGVTFAYFVVFPLMFSYLLKALPVGVVMRPDISQYLDFTLTLFFAFGIAFEVPIVVWVLLRFAIVSKAQLRQWRPYVIVFAFVIGMVLTPPDVISQVLLAIPIWLLFELGLCLPV